MSVYSSGGETGLLENFDVRLSEFIRAYAERKTEYANLPPRTKRRFELKIVEKVGYLSSFRVIYSHSGTLPGKKLECG